MHRCKAIFIFLLVPVLIGGIGADRAPRPGPDMSMMESSRARVSSFLRSSVNPSVVPAAAAVVVNGDGILLSAGACADIDTPFGIASLSKIFTSIVVLSLCQEGIMNLDDRVERYVPCAFRVPPGLAHGNVTVRHLLAHTAGIPAGAPNGEPVSVVYPGGTCYEYANAGYCLLKSVIERASSRSYEELVHERIFSPLAMTSSRADTGNGTGGIISTARDLSRFAMMLIGRGSLDGRTILRGEYFDEMLSPTLPMPPGDDDYYYSLGWEVVQKAGRVESYYKAGRWYGEGSAIQVFPATGCAILYLCNPPDHLSSSYMRWRDSLMGIMRNSVASIYHLKGEATWPLKLYPRRDLYAGIYRDSAGRTLTIAEEAGSLSVIRDGNRMALSPFSSLRYLDPAGHIYSFVWNRDRMEAVAAGNRYYILRQY